ncbi:MAG: outer membrane protein assembly factor BamA [Phycisphaerae bacterium]|nr:outer membrane protein assembly factor BamA [Gemmatimonadaceae bacterium]
MASAVAPSRLAAQDAADVALRCATPDSIVVVGNRRVSQASIREKFDFKPGEELATPSIDRALRALYAMGQFEPEAHISRCDLASVPGKVLLVFEVKERPLLADVRVQGVKALSERDVRDRVDLLIGRPVDPAQVQRARTRIDSLYESKGYYLAVIKPDSTVTSDGRIALTYTIDEGRRLAISGIEITGNTIRTKTIAGAMKTKPEGFLFWHKGEFDENMYQSDVGDTIPALYARLGFLDMRINKDTLVVDRAKGKGLIKLDVEEGPQYRLGSFEIGGNRRFSTDELNTFYPFDDEGRTISQRVMGIVRREPNAPEGMFNQAKWDDAVQKLNTHYRNYGYLYARIQPTIERVIDEDSVPTVNMRWDIDERNPAIVNRINIAGNDFTSEDCIRRQIFLPPGAPFNYDNLIQSFQSIRNMGFFEQDMAFPDPKPINDQGDVDITFTVKEKRTGSINFGASMGQGNVGFGGFIGVEQPNLFGLCKKGSLNWQYGRYFNDFTATYQDPTLRGGRVSGSLSAYRNQSRIVIADLGQNTRTGASVRFGFPVPWSLRSTIAITYQGEATTFQSGQVQGARCTRNCFRSNIGAEYTYDTRIELPFPTAGSMRSIAVDLSGGPLGGTVNFQRLTAEARGYATLAQFGTNIAASPKLVVGLKTNAGALFGNAGAFFFQQKFAVGGVQYGQSVRGYEEFSITPLGYDSSGGQFNTGASGQSAFGSAFFTLTGELGFRFSDALYLNVFTDAGNNWASARQFNPTRLFRSAGFSGTTKTPLGLLGLDIAYGFDRTKVDPFTLRVVPDPRWKFHFRLGQIF